MEDFGSQNCQPKLGLFGHLQKLAALLTTHSPAAGAAGAFAALQPLAPRPPHAYELDTAWGHLPFSDGFLRAHAECFQAPAFSSLHLLVKLFELHLQGRQQMAWRSERNGSLNAAKRLAVRRQRRNMKTGNRKLPGEANAKWGGGGGGGARARVCATQSVPNGPPQLFACGLCLQIGRALRQGSCEDLKQCALRNDQAQHQRSPPREL